MKFVRLVFNNNNYQSPTGMVGKSLNPKTFENRFGFGWEEWLFNDRFRLSDGYNYGFIRAAGHTKLKVLNNVQLVCFNSTIKLWMPVRAFTTIEVLDSKILQWAETEYRKQGLIELINDDLRRISPHVSSNMFNFNDFCNVRYRSDQELEPINRCTKHYPRYSIIYNL